MADAGQTGLPGARPGDPSPGSATRRLGERVREHTVPLVVLGFVAAVGWGVRHFVQLSGTLAQQLALQEASRYAQAVADFPTLYGAQAPGGRTGGGLPEDRIRLFGERPLPWRHEGGPHDDFERRALEELTRRPDVPFHRVERLDGREMLRYATPSALRYSTADVIQPSCLACHNSHPDPVAQKSAARDGRGVLEVVIPLDQAVAHTRERLRGTFGLLAGLALLAAVALGVLGRVIRRLRRTSADALALAAEQARVNRRLEEEIAERARAEAEAARARDQALEASRLKSQFVNNISDGIRTPMNGIVGAVELLLEQDLSDGQREYARIAKSSTEALLAIVNDILDFSHVAYGNFALKAVDFSVRALVGEVLDSARAAAHAKLLELSCDVAPDVPDAVVGDPGRLLQVLLNLVENAIEFTTEGEVAIRVRREPPVGDEIVLYVEVADTGVGIAPEMQAVVFEAFTQAEASPGRRHGGVGLGLGLCAELVRRMGGRIWVDSVPGRGSTFHFTTPLAPGRERRDDDAPERGAGLRGVEVLVVESDPATRHLLVGLVETWDAYPIVADSAPAALFTLRRAEEAGSTIPLVLVNAKLLGSGGDLLRRVHDDRRLAGTRMVAFGSIEPPGVDGWVTMPVAGADLLRAVRSALEAPPKGVARSDQAGNGHQPALRRVLVAEDNPGNRDLAVLSLTRRGYQVVAVADGRQAVEACARQTFDVILMDLQMPVMDGVAATAAIRAREQGTDVHVPIIALTALARESDRERSLQAGMDAFLTKPVRPPDLVAEIERVLAAQRGPARQADTELRGTSRVADESRALLEELRAGCERCDAPAVSAASRRLQESMAALGPGHPAAAVAARLGQQASDGDVDGARLTLAALEQEIGRLS